MIVPFGKREAVGVILALDGDSAPQATRLREPRRIVRDEPALDADVLDLIHFCADYYQHSLGEVCATVLPTTLRRPRAAAPTHARLTTAGRAADLATLPARALLKHQLMTRLQAGDLPLDEARSLSARASAALKTLIGLGWVEPTHRLSLRGHPLRRPQRPPWQARP